MTISAVMDLAHQTFAVAFWIAIPVLAFSMGVGLCVSVLQAATQIQEASLTFLPKLIGMGVALVLFGPWMLEKLIVFTITLINAGGAGLYR